MPGHDDLFKELLRHFFADLLELVVPEIAEVLEPDRAEFLDPEVFAAPPESTRRQADVAARVPTRGGAPEMILVHVEVESEARRDMELRMLEYAVMLRGRYRTVVLPIVVYLTGGPREGLTTRAAAETFGGMTVLRVSYVALSLSRSRAEDYLARPQSLAWALAALMSTDLQPAEHRAACLKAIAGAELTDHQEFLLYNCVRSYLELDEEQQRRYDEMIAREDMSDVAKMEMTWAERTVLKGREEGRMEGRVEGRVEGERRILQRVLEARFGPLSDRIRRRVEALDSTDEIERLVDRALEAGSLDELMLNG